ncbi:winged helix-turn-helix domain-containing protein [Psychrobium sp. 1_MG-2023]|uniref:winged helix-turn-helix domain-containing protein n=1 Tax=Psychrobium sp. 1_MG-2023 TaxID=3062624 RepID=UPI000C3345CE|nr:winged helix-turn-helix domain-containing protein [Psychrobium sp. 1_MG-2023]MDP2562664.1 winged helix-turn-helix domain-containing protein [Psychrobium sp. 1_MG-2023]PKF53807.1 hypothetical protein CW748_17550 [Alteromonadales bacterium alter-6D02]
MPIYQFAQFHFDDSSGTLRSCSDANNVTATSDELVQHTQVELRHKVASLLSYLITQRDRIVSKEELLAELWQHGDYRENSLTQSIRELRIALGDNAKAPTFIKTYPQRGYQWIQPLGEVIDVSLAPPAAMTNDHHSQPHLITEQDEQSNKQASPRSRSTTQLRRYIGLFVIILCSAMALWQHHNSSATQQTETTTSQSGVKSVVVLPFINATEQASMAWLELGLADMLAIDLQRLDAIDNNQLHVTPPDVANALLLDAQLDWPALPVHIRSLLKEHQLEAAIFASVRLHGEQQVLDFQIIYADGRTQQGSITYPSLPASLVSVTQQLLHLLIPQRKRQQSSEVDDPLAAQALAQGMQALQQEGPLKAHKYFQASLLLGEDNHWARAYSARSSISLGQWQQAIEQFTLIPPAALVSDPTLNAFIHYWQAELAFRRGDDALAEAITLAISKAEAASDAKLMTRSYRLQAKLSWQNKDWAAHNHWQEKAQQLQSLNTELNIEADKLFYLGSPNNAGLEKAPDNNLQQNQALLLKALNFYQQLANKNMIAASQLAIAQNYTFALSLRADALKHAIALYEQLSQPYELAQALNYAGFYHMQLHDGATASRYFTQAKDIALSLGAQPLVEISDFYLAFAMLDQGLDQQSLGRHGKDESKLKQAITHLKRFIGNEPTPELHGSALVFLGWAYTELGQFDLALTQLEEAKTLNAKLNLATTLGYSNYSIMRIHLEREDYQSVIDMADEKVTTRLQATYLARAYFEHGQARQAINVLTQLKTKQPHLWQPEDNTRLTLYQQSLSGLTLNLPDEPKAHLVYCESDWAQ